MSSHFNFGPAIVNDDEFGRNMGPSKITDEILLGSQRHAHLDITRSFPNFINAANNACEQQPIWRQSYHQFPFEDWADGRKLETIEMLAGAVTILRNNILRGGSTFVYCQMGINRSATVVITYLSIFHGMTWDKALNYVTAKRRIVDPAWGLEDASKILIAYVNKHRPAALEPVAETPPAATLPDPPICGHLDLSKSKPVSELAVLSSTPDVVELPP